MAAPPVPRPADDLRDIQGPLPVATLPPFLLSGGVLLLAAGLYFLRRRCHHPLDPPQAVAAPTHAGEDALAVLAGAYRQGMCPGDQALAHLDALVRQTLSSATSLPAPHLTRPEIVARAAALLGPEDLNRLDRLLARCDLAKFAGHRPGQEEVEDALSLAGALINALRPERGV